MTTAELHEGDALMVQPLGDTMEVLAQWTSDTWERYHVRFPDEIVSVDEEMVAQASTLRVWPTPATTTINVESTTPGRIAISSMTGSTVMTVMVDGLEIIPIDSLAPGVYALRHENGASAMFVVR